MSMFLQPLFGRWRAMRRRHRAERDLRDALFDLNDHLLSDVGLGRPGAARYPQTVAHPQRFLGAF
jgi:uncharacterized protein YjiS (DUF1127 family)